ncbi:lipopolysaccharide transport periplasmic protein LptA [Thalassospira xiamenensis]|nr:lipopolysaccharide transport periplasmic protein LptA [Thalassospira xiamenensis]
MKPYITATISSLVLLLAMPQAALAQGQDDFSKPIKINADDESFDIKRNLAIFTNNVVISQGTLLIKADKLIAERDRERQVEMFVATGTPATYQQQLDDGSLIEAQANEIKYDQINQVLTLTGSAEVNQNNSLVRGGVLRYDFVSQTLTSERGEANDEQVETIILPRNRNQDGDGTNNEPATDDNNNDTTDNQSE